MTDEELLELIAPYIPVEIERRNETSGVVVLYLDKHDSVTGPIRKRLNAWETTHSAADREL